MISFEERYNQIIDCIEENIKETNTVIRDKVISLSAVNQRSFSDAFTFITQYTLMDYIRIRKLWSIYDEHTSSQRSFEDIAADYQIQDFSRNFKNQIGKYPSKVKDEDIENSIYKPLFFEQLSKSEKRMNDLIGVEPITTNRMSIQTLVDADKLISLANDYGYSYDKIIAIDEISKDLSVEIEILCECLFNNEFVYNTKTIRKLIPYLHQAGYKSREEGIITLKCLMDGLTPSKIKHIRATSEQFGVDSAFFLKKILYSMHLVMLGYSIDSIILKCYLESFYNSDCEDALIFAKMCTENQVELDSFDFDYMTFYREYQLELISYDVYKSLKEALMVEGITDSVAEVLNNTGIVIDEDGLLIVEDIVENAIEYENDLLEWF